MNEEKKNIYETVKNMTAADLDVASFKVSGPIVKNGNAPACIIRPKDVEELAKVVTKANTSRFSVVPVSSTGPHDKSGICCHEDHVMADLSGWNKVTWINRRNRVAMIEPGVTYGDLIKAISPHGMTVPMPLAPKSGKSVIAGVFDREPTTWPNKQWDYIDPVASTEIVFGTGNIFRTGSGAGPGTIEAQRKVGGAQKYGCGPGQTDFQRLVQGSQGSMGIVTWITIRCELKPSMEKTYLIGEDKLDNIIPYVYEVQRPYLGEHSFILDSTATALLMTHKKPETFAQIQESLPSWICLQNIAGFDRLPKDRIVYQEEDIREKADRNGLKMVTSIGSVSASSLLNTALTPCGEKDWRHGLKGHSLSVFFLSTLDQAPSFIKTMKDLAKQHQVNPEMVGTYLQPVVQNHACHVEFMVPYDPSDAGEVEKMKQLEADAVKALDKEGAYFSRPYGAAADIVFDNNPTNVSVLKQMQGIFDPNDVLNKGKFGI